MTRRSEATLYWLSFLLMVILAIVGVKQAFGQDVVNNSTNPYLTLTRGAGWGATGNCAGTALPPQVSACGVNNNYIWSPPTPDSTVCVAVTNNNTTSSHAISLALFQALDASVQQFTGNTTSWSQVTIVGTTFPQTVNANSTVSFFFRSTSAARLALQVTGASGGAGSPDSANITVVQPSIGSFCGSAINGSTISNVVGVTGAGNTIAAGVQQPVLVGGKQNSAGNEINTALYADVDSFSHAFLVGTTGSWNESTGTWNTGQLNQANNGSPQLFFTLAGGFQSDVPPGGGAGDTMASARVSKAYGTMVSTPWQWGATQEAGGSQQPLMSFQTQKDASNPAAGALLLAVNINNATNQGFTPTRITVSCSAACDYTINRVSNAGTTCSATTVVKAFDPAVTGANLYVGGSTGTCVANPTITQTLYHIFLAAGATQVIDMTGYSYQRSATNGVGFDVQNGGALTGTASTTIEFIQRGAQQ